MSATENVVKQATGLVEALIVVQNNVATLEEDKIRLEQRLKEAEAINDSMKGQIAGLREVIKDMARDGEGLIRQNERMKMTLSQLMGTVERARDDLTPAEPPSKEKVEPKRKYIPENEAENKGPFYGVHTTSNGEVIIYPPRECQTLHQLRHFYQVAGIVVAQGKLIERGGIHLRGLSYSAKVRLRRQYQLNFPDSLTLEEEVSKTFVKDTEPHHLGGLVGPGAKT